MNRFCRCPSVLNWDDRHNSPLANQCSFVMCNGVTAKGQAQKDFLCTLNGYSSFLCISTVFAVARCLSICHIAALYPHCWKYCQTSFSAQSPHHSGFWSHSPIPNSKGNLFSGMQNTLGWEWWHFAIFNWNRRLSCKWYDIDPWFIWNFNRKSDVLRRMVTFSMILADPFFQGHGTFEAEVEYLKNSASYRPSYSLSLCLCLCLSLSLSLSLCVF